VIPAQNATAVKFKRHIGRFTEISNLFPDTHQTTDKCRRDGPRKLNRISARGSVHQIAMRFGGIGLRRRERIKRPKSGGRIRTICGLTGRAARDSRSGSYSGTMAGTLLLSKSPSGQSLPATRAVGRMIPLSTET
jgi:hypothetical protein